MKKMILTILLCLFMIFGLTGCFSTEEVEEDFYPTEVDGISMAFKTGTFTPTGAKIIIKDTNGPDAYLYGEEFYIEKKENENWVKLENKCDNCAFLMIGHGVDGDGLLELNQIWGDMYGELEKGTYRLVKWISPGHKNTTTKEDKSISLEFTID